MANSVIKDNKVELPVMHTKASWLARKDTFN